MNSIVRDNKWLEEQMFDLWEMYFNDVPRKNLVVIKFGRRAQRQLGCIKWVRNNTKIKGFMRRKLDELKVQDDTRVSLITVTSHYKDLEIPEYVVQETIAHEMIHYAHGFFSPLKQIYDHPHKGGIIRKEMVARGLEPIYKASKKWLRAHWSNYLRRNR